MIRPCTQRYIRVVATKARRDGKTIVFTNGVFDLLHLEVCVEHIPAIRDDAMVGHQQCVEILDERPPSSWHFPKVSPVRNPCRED